VNRPIRKVAIGMAVLFLALFVNLNVVQIVQGSDYRNHAGNARVHYNEYSSPRGSIQVQGVNVAVSKKDPDPLKYLRVYPQGPLYASVTGYFPFNGAPTQVEASENDILSGDSDRLFTTRLADILTGRGLQGGSVQLTLNRAAQKAAYAAMKGGDGQYRPGAVVALNPSTGAILASVSTPSYDPNVLSQHNLSKAAHALGCYQALDIPAQGDHENAKTYAARRAASVRAQLVLRRGGSTQFLADYLKHPKTFALGATVYSADPSNDGAEVAAWVPYISLDNLEGAKGVTSSIRRQLTAAYKAQFAAHDADVDAGSGQYANGKSGCGDVPQNPTEVFAKDNLAPSPLINKGFYERYFAGSIFKIVDSAAALSSDVKGDTKYTPSTRIPAPNGFRPYDPKNTKACPATLNTACVENFDGETCDNGKTATLELAFAKSCNTAFAQLAVQKLGGKKLVEQAKKFGFDSTSQFDGLPPPYTASTVGNEQQLDTDLGYLAQSAFGQRDVQVTPILAAMMSAAVANNGTMMKPYLVRSELRPNLTPLDTTTQSQFSQVIDPSLAGELQQMMESVITSPQGTGGPANVTEFGDQVKVGGKTGTADTGATSASKIQPDAWFTGFALVKGEPKIAVAVLLEHAGVAGNEATGGLAAGPVAKKVITAYLKSIGVH